MNLKIFLSKMFCLLNQNKNNIVISIFISFLLYFYFIFAVIPYCDLHGFSCAECKIETKNQVIYLILTIPFIIWYIIAIFGIIKKLKFMRIIIYPIVLLTLFLCVFISVSAFGYAYSMLCIFVFLYLFPICLVITEIYGAIQDIKTFKNTTVPDNYNIYQNISVSFSKWKSRFLQVFYFFKNICQKVWNYFTEDVEK